MKSLHVGSKLSVSAWVTVSLAGLCWWSASAAAAAQPGELADWKVTSSDPPVTIRFRYCPAGTIRPGKPSNTGGAANLPPPLPIRDFYIGETEVTLAQFRAILGDAGLAPLKVQAASQTANPQFFETLQKGQLEPAFFVGLDGAVDFCNRLQAESDDVRSKTPQPSLDTRLFRLPSHVEWQYAARAVASADTQASLPHFGRWVRFSELSAANQQKCQEVWLSLGHTDKFPDNQDSFLELTRTTDSAQQGKVKEILTEAFDKAFGSAPRGASGVGSLQQVGKTRANAWNLTDVHEGVSEWTLWATKIERGRDLWSKLATARKSEKPLTGQENVFLSGGSFAESYGGKLLSHFTVWGGPKLTDDQPQPFAFQSEIVSDQMPGFRVLMERVISEDWLFVLRKGVFQKRQITTAAAEYLKSSRAVVDELTEAENPSRVAIDFYTELTANRSISSQRFHEILLKVSQMQSAASPSGSGSAASKLAALLMKTDPDKATDNSQVASDEGAYFQSLAALVQPPSKR
ncbi:hypothetical protein LBMAG52_17250 [Planctomycetia bacterium]|nr:hypothetical protein LBMAG52_17250 [Planctomycetia bacterium]